jgi:hypothetical protein
VQGVTASNIPLTTNSHDVQLEDWGSAIELHDRLQALGVQPAACESVSSALCKALASIINPIHSALYQDGMPVRNAAETRVLPGHATQFLRMLGPSLSRDVRLFSKASVKGEKGDEDMGALLSPHVLHEFWHRQHCVLG